MLHPSGTPVGRAEAGGKGGLLYRYYYSDHLGSVRTVVSSGGTTLETRDYYPYGLEMPGRVSVTGERAPEGYTGHELDAETAMNYIGSVLDLLSRGGDVIGAVHSRFEGGEPPEPAASEVRW